MNPGSDQKIDASQYKGILPAHMRQGIPPYLQVLFAARPKLPFLNPMPRTRLLTPQGFFGQLDYAKMKEASDKAKQARQEHPAELPEGSKKTFATSMKKAERARRWKAKMREHIQRQKEEYAQWLREREKSAGNRSYEPRNTLLVSKLVG